MKRWKIILMGILAVLLLGIPAWGNASEPPSILLIVPGAPQELVVSVGDGEEYIEASRRDKAFESYFLFYQRETDPVDDLYLRASGGGYDLRVPVGELTKAYHNVYTLDLDDGTLIEGKDPVRAAVYVIIRVALTLMIEGLVFFLMGFRSKRSWTIFLVVNLITQGALNLWINTVTYNDYSLFFSLVFYEFVIIVVEMVAFLNLLKEHKKWRRVLFVLLANILSLLAGGYILTVLPY
ncbi:hypothetical protein [Gudongella sp. SC589]|uniref:hypothetical protein n=1 Tax=Gudongella sp. SC589 TaxID=3385990 RepID=UPI00390487D6